MLLNNGLNGKSEDFFLSFKKFNLSVLYAFDVHCNSFFPMFVMLYVIHYFVSPLLVAHGFIPELLSNLLFMVAASYYHYLNFLGYDVLPFLERTTFFLYPIGVIIVLSPILILSGFNPSRYFMNMYFSQREQKSEPNEVRLEKGFFQCSRLIDQMELFEL
ncbi:hypothetical protein Goshw_003561 [Gossypium schwendimanii]|uniref:UNC-50 family protein n=1 Tax=Gossypium schwendimanii TaxID=34291 RepID=A0A7J9LTK3_GOSSC|nr:hypothetical protein [Gossypium schwendimanii]